MKAKDVSVPAQGVAGTRPVGHDQSVIVGPSYQRLGPFSGCYPDEGGGAGEGIALSRNDTGSGDGGVGRLRGAGNGTGDPVTTLRGGEHRAGIPARQWSGASGRNWSDRNRIHGRHPRPSLPERAADLPGRGGTARYPRG